MIRFSPTFRLSLSAVLMAASLVLIADLIGLVPNADAAALEARRRTCEAIAVQLSVAASRSDMDLVGQTLDFFVRRNADVFSAAMRRANGDIFSQTPDHEKHWVPPAEGRSTATHVLVPVFAGAERWGSVEVSFAPLRQGAFGWLRNSVWGLALFMVVTGLGAFYLMLRRALRELDPRGTIPQRIKSAFDALAEGVLILDNRGFIVLANAAFAEKSGHASDALIGVDATRLEWYQPASPSRPPVLPWRQTLTSGTTESRVLLRLVGTNNVEAHTFAVTSSPLFDDRRQPRGALVTFDDVTVLENKNQELQITIERLQASEREIKRKNEQLYQLATHDSLTTCLNRRAFFAEFESMYRTVETEGTALSCLMIDIDHFKAINDSFGHGVGDKVIKWVSEVIQSQVGPDGLVCRYGGEEFCAVLKGSGVFQANGIAQQIRREIEENAGVRFGEQALLTVSIGLSSVHFGAKTAADLITQADQALYAAKGGGRNRVTRWNTELAGQIAPPPSVRRQARTIERETPTSPELGHLRTGAPAAMRRVAGTDGAPVGLAGRVEFVERIEQALAASVPADKSVAVLSLVPNHFRRISDTLGAPTGDVLLREIGERARKTLRGTQGGAALGNGEAPSLLARLGKDEFGIVLTDITGEDDVHEVIKRIFSVLSRPLQVGGNAIEIDVSIGVALTPEGGRTPEVLLKNATAARHQAQERGDGERCEFYSDAMGARSLRRMRIMGELQQALDTNQFVPHFQPQQDLRAGALVAWEVLLRWPHPELGSVPPSEFIPIAEQTGFIHSLCRWVLRAGCLQAKAWSNASLGNPRVTVNLSAVQLQRSDIVTQVREVLTETGLPPERLELEITESAIMRDQRLAQRTLRQLKQLGVRIAIDDFGAGHSGLSYIKDFPVDVVKIDRSFLNDVLVDPRAAELYGGIVDMARRLSLYVVAEGVETQEDLAFVERRGCDAIQGQLLSGAVPAAQVERLLRGGSAFAVPSRRLAQVVSGEFRGDAVGWKTRA